MVWRPFYKKDSARKKYPQRPIEGIADEKKV